MGGSLRVTTALLVVVGVVILFLPAVAGALPPEYPAAWGISPGGMRLLDPLTTDAGLCKGPSGYVFEVASRSSGGGVQAVVSKVAVGSGAVADSWSYPAVPGSETYLPKAIARDPSGNVVVAMEDRTGGGWMVAKFTAAGKLLWDEAYAAGADRAPWGVACDRTGAVVVVGHCSVAAGSGYDGAVVKWSTGGAFRWAKTLRGAGAVNDGFLGVGTDAYNNVYVCGALGGTRAAAVLRSYTAKGGKRWFATAPQATRSTSFTALVVKGSNVYAAGACSGATRGGLLAAKYTLAGKRLWGGLKTLLYPGDAQATTMAVDRANAVVVAGEAELASGDVPALWKVSPLGKSAWHREVTATGWSNGGFAAVALDSKGRVYAAGMSGAGQPESGTLMMRYSASGAPQAKWTPDGQAPSVGEFLHVLVLSDTQVVASGILEQGTRSAVVFRAKTTR